MKDKDIEYVPFSSIAEVNPAVSLTHLSSDMSVSFIPMSDVTETGQWIHHQEQKLANLLGRGYTSFQEGDILFAKITPCMENGKGAHAIGLVNGMGFGTTEFHVLRAKIGASDRFIYHWLQSDLLRLKAEALMIGSAGQRRVTPKFFDVYTIPSLSLSEQKRIANILDAIDEQIQHAEQIIAKIKLQREGLLHKLLTCGIDENGQLRDPIAHPEQFKDSILGKIPREWRINKLEDISSQIVDGTHFTPNYVKEGIPFLRVTDIQNIGEMNFRNVKKISPEEHAILIKRCKPEFGDILYSKNGTVGIPRLVDWRSEFSIFVSLCLIKPLSHLLLSSYLVEILGSFYMKKQIRVRSKQLTVINLHLEEIKEFLIPLPNKAEQCRIMNIVNNINSAIGSEETYLRKLKLFKKGLIHDLLTGKVRVPIEQKVEG